MRFEFSLTLCYTFPKAICESMSWGGMMMNRELFSKLMRISISGLILAGLLFAGLFLLASPRTPGFLFAALSCFILAGLFHCVRTFNKR